MPRARSLALKKVEDQAVEHHIRLEEHAAKTLENYQKGWDSKFAAYKEKVEKLKKDMNIGNNRGGFSAHADSYASRGAGYPSGSRTARPHTTAGAYAEPGFDLEGRRGSASEDEERGVNYLPQGGEEGESDIFGFVGPTAKREKWIQQFKTSLYHRAVTCAEGKKDKIPDSERRKLKSVFSMIAKDFSRIPKSQFKTCLLEAGMTSSDVVDRLWSAMNSRMSNFLEQVLHWI